MSIRFKTITRAVIPAAGLGTRFLPATKATPKEMLPIVDKPTIQYIVEEALASGIEDILIITGRSKRAIEDHFDRSIELELNLAEKGKNEWLEMVRSISDIRIHYIRQKEPRGLGHAILCAKQFIGNEPFAVLHEKVSSYGIVATRGTSDPRTFAVADMVEKPPVNEAPSNMAVLGRYVITPEIFELLEHTDPGAGGEIQLTDGLRSLLKIQPVYAYNFEGRRYDVGDKQGFLEATVEYALRRPDLHDGFLKYLKEIVIK